MFDSIIRSAFGAKIGRLTLLNSVILFMLLMSGFTVFAGSINFSGTLEATDPIDGHLDRPYDTCEFTVSVTGDYTLSITSPLSPPDDDMWANITTSPTDVWVGSYQFVNNNGYQPTISLTAGTTYYLHPNTYPSSVPLSYDISLSGPGDITGTCDSTVEAAPEAPAVEIDDTVYPPDNRINWQFGHLDAVVYPHDSGDGVVVYCYVDGQTWVGMYINQAVVDNASTTTQATPVMEYNDNGCQVAFYMLDSGEYQINIYTWDGKLYEMIADNINFNGVVMREVQ